MNWADETKNTTRIRCRTELGPKFIFTGGKQRFLKNKPAMSAGRFLAERNRGDGKGAGADGD